MRELKFRAWHTNQKKMYSCEELVTDQMTLLTDGRFINVNGVDTQLSQIDNKGIMIPLQYTGLKDKNGKEVYEGDILQTERDDNTHLSKFVVEWNSKEACFQKVREDNTVFLFDNRGCSEKIVIGNIYENKEDICH